jgi:hypothetical protein
MPLFKIQDSDRPMWVFGNSFSEALQMWQNVIAVENELDSAKEEMPLGINYICDDSDIILDIKDH